MINSLATVLVVAMCPSEHTISCIEMEFSIKVIEVASGAATFGDIILCIAALELPPPVFPLVAMNAVHASHHIIPWAVEREGLVIVVYILCPGTGCERYIVRCHFTTSELVFAIFFTITMLAPD